MSIGEEPAKKRSFARELSGRGAAEIRSQVSAVFSNSFGSVAEATDSPSIRSSNVASLLGSIHSDHSSVFSSPSVGSMMTVEAVDPLDYEKFVQENIGILEGDANRDLCLFPEDDIAVTSLPRKFRTVEIPVPGPAKRSDDPLVRDCVKSFTQDWTVVNRKFGSFHGQDEQCLSRRFASCKRTSSYTKMLPKHQYEVDLPPQQDTISEQEKRLYRQSIASNVDYNLEAAESDALLLDMLESREDSEVDEENQQLRTSNRHPSLFGLYPLPEREDAKENRTPTLPPSEHQGLRLLVKVSELRFDLNIEPIFAVMALYDAKEKKKISESFHLDCNSSDLVHMLDDHFEERSMASLSRSAIFNITYPNPDVFLIIKVEKVLQQGDISDAVEPYLKARDLSKKDMEKHKLQANFFCQQLGQYRMPFAWTAINVLDIIAGNQAAGSTATTVSTSDARKDSLKGDQSMLEKRGTTPEPRIRRDARSNSTASTTSSSKLLEDNYTDSPRERRETLSQQQNSLALLTQNFRPVTLTVNVFFKQESDKLLDEDLFRFLGEMKKQSAMLSRKFKNIPGNLKVDISAPYENMPCCLTSNLWEVEPFPDNRSRRPTREVEEFPPREVYTPCTTYKNMLYVCPQTLDFRSGKGRNVGVKVQFMAGEEKEDVCPAIYGKSCSPSFLRESWCPVLYHNRTPEFYEEVKIELPAKLTDKHHILFTIYQISCQKPKPAEPFIQEPTFIGSTWVPMLQHGKLQLGEFNLCVTADRPPPCYSQIRSDVALPSVKWVDGHKPIFRVNISMVSSIHPQDDSLLGFMSGYYDLNTRLGSDFEEKALTSSISSLTLADSEQLVQFLHITLSNLACLLVRPSITEESAEVPGRAFEAMANIVRTVHSLPLPQDKHGRSSILASYVQYVFSAPQGQHPAGAFDVKTATLTKGRKGSGDDDHTPAGVKKAQSMRAQRGVHFNTMPSGGPPAMPEELEGEPSGRRGSQSSALKKVFHEELALQWILCRTACRPTVLANSWFFFELLIKSMAQHLHRVGKLNSPRRERFSVKFMKDLETLICNVAVEIAERHIKDGNYARSLNTSLAFFVHDAFSLMDRGFVFCLIKNYLKKFTLSIKDYNLTEFRIDFYRIVCSHEHYITLNMPLGAILYPMGAGSSHSSPSGSISSTFENLDVPNVEAMGELSQEFRTHHYLSGLVLMELAVVLDGKNSKLREQAIECLRDLLASHDSDSRYNSPESRARIASIYLPLLSIVMDNYQHLYKGADGWEDWTTTFERNTDIRRSVVVKESIDGGWEIETPEHPEPSNEHLLGPVSTRNLLICIMWVFKNIDSTLLAHWWATLSISRMNVLLNVLDLAVACFEYRGKRNLATQLSGMSSQASKGSDAKQQLANAILGGEGTARERLAQRRRAGTGGAEVLRWGKTYWQATAEQSERPKVDIEVDAVIEGSLAAEASLVVLDTLELLIQTVSMVENLQSMLGKALEVLLHLMGSNQSTEVMSCIFATQRSIVYKFPELLFEEETEQCADLCARLLRHCSSSVPDIRAWACASLYLLMRHNFDLGNTFARVKVQVTVALSSIVAGTSSFNEHHLRRSLKTLISYAENDNDMEDTSFPDQVRELALNLHRILLDTVKMQEFQDDPEMLIDLMYRISKGYQNSPDLRLTWLQYMAEKHSSRKNYTEAAMCLVHAAALVAEYLYLLEGQSYLPVGCVAFQKLSPNVLEESAISDDILTPEEEGICTSKFFSERGLIGLLEQAAAFFKEAHLYEAVDEVYNLVVPIYRAQRAHAELEKVHRKMADCYKELVHRGQHRFLGTYFRVGFYGILFGDLDQQEYIYKEAALTRLGEFSLRLHKLYQDKLGADKVEVLKESSDVDPGSLDPRKGFIQITYVEPYFDNWEMPDRVTIFDKSFNIRRFVFSTPYTLSGKAHGELNEQCIQKTILTSKEAFPYVKKRSRVVGAEKIELNPLEVAIIGMQDKIKSLKQTLQHDPPDGKLLQMQLQGGIATAVNQGPFAVAKSFLDVPKSEQGHLHRKLKVCFKEFTRRCEEALEVNKLLITEEQMDYQKELQRKFRDFRDKMEPMVSTKKKHKRSRDRALLNIASARSSRLFSSGD